MKFWLIGMVLLAASAAQSQTVWRCGPDGRSYANTPCPDGRAVDTTQARPAADLGSARQTARRDKALAAQLLHERQRREAQATAGSGLAAIRGSRLGPWADVAASPKKTPRGKRQQRPEGPGIWHAVAPASRPARD